MQTLTYTRIPRMIIAAISLSGLSGCATVYDDGYGYDDGYSQRYSSAAHVTYYDYRYYPDIDCYYDQHARVYYYHERDRWVRAHTLPQYMRSRPGIYITMRSRYERPYEDQKHRQQYSRHHDRNSAPQYRDYRRDRRRDDGHTREYRDANRARDYDRSNAPSYRHDRSVKSRTDTASRDYQDGNRYPENRGRRVAITSDKDSHRERVAEQDQGPSVTRQPAQAEPASTATRDRNPRTGHRERKPEQGPRQTDKSQQNVADNHRDKRRGKQENKGNSRMQHQSEEVATADDTQAYNHREARGTGRWIHAQ